MPGGRGLGAARGWHRPNPCPCPQGSVYDGLADNYDYGTASRSSFYSKFQAGTGSWGYPVRSRFLGTCGHGPRFEQEKASWLLRRGWGAAGFVGITHLTPPCAPLLLAALQLSSPWLPLQTSLEPLSDQKLRVPQVTFSALRSLPHLEPHQLSL